MAALAESPDLETTSRVVLAALPMPIYTTDAEGRLTFYNQAAARFWGREPKLGAEKWSGSHKIFRTDGTPMPLEECPMARTLTTGKPVRGVEAIVERPDGSRIHFTSHPTPLFDARGRLTGGVNMLQDITTQKDLERSQAQLSAIVESSDDAILSKNLDGIIQTWNAGAERIFGYTQAEAIGQPVLMLIPPERHNEEPEIIARIRRGERIDHYETIRRRKDGSLIDISLTISPVKNASGEIIGASKVARDISERKQADRSQAQLSAIVESSDDAILSKNLDGIIQSWNYGAERVFGYTAAEAIGQPVVMLIPPDRHNEEPEIIARIRKGQRIEHYETVRRRKDGSLIDISLTISPVKNKKGEIIGASKVARDISERRRDEETKDLLLHEIKHRVKNTLGTVQAIASQTFRAAPREERDAFGARLRAMSEAHDLLTNQDWGHVAVTDIVARAVAAFNAERFTVRGDNITLPSAKALLLAMAIHELGTNAVKYGALSNTLGRVAIDWKSEGGRMRLHWHESGGPVVTGPPAHRGFGTNLIQRAMAGEGGASFDYASDGLKGTLEIRL